MRVGISMLGVNRQLGGFYQYSVSMLRDLASVVPATSLVVFVDEGGSLAQEIDSLPPAVYRHVPADAPSLIRTILRFVSGLNRWSFRGGWIKGRFALLDDASCDVIFHPYWTFASVVTQTPAVATLLDIGHRDVPEFMRWRRRISLELLIRSIALNARAVVTHTEQMRNVLIRDYEVPKERIRIIPLKAPEYLFEEHGVSPSEVLARYGLRSGYVFLPGRFGTYRNTERVLEAVCQLRLSDPDLDVRAVLVGVRDEEMKTARACIASLGLEKGAHLIGFVPDADMAALYRSAGVLAFLNLRGPASIPIYEAWGLGCPLVVSDIPGHRELVQDGGIIVDPLDVASIANALRKPLRDPSVRNRLRESGAARFADVSNFDYSNEFLDLAITVTGKRM